MTTARQSAPRSRHAFTLIEIMVVIAIVAMVMTISIPAIYQIVRPETMRTSVDKMMEACKEARSYAILQSVTTELRIRPADNSISVVSIGSSTPEKEGPLFDAEGAPLERKPVGGPSIFDWKFSERITMRAVGVNGYDWTEQEEAAVRFYPDGTSDEMNVVLHHKDKGEQRQIWLEVVTGLPDFEVDEHKFHMK